MRRTGSEPFQRRREADPALAGSARAKVSSASLHCALKRGVVVESRGGLRLDPHVIEERRRGRRPRTRISHGAETGLVPPMISVALDGNELREAGFRAAVLIDERPRLRAPRPRTACRRPVSRRSRRPRGPTGLLGRIRPAPRTRSTRSGSRSAPAAIGTSAQIQHRNHDTDESDRHRRSLLERSGCSCAFVASADTA